MSSAESITTPSLALTSRSLAAFCSLITERLGIKMSDTKLPMLQSRLQRRLRVLGLPSLEAYQRHIFHPEHGADELVHFFDAVTTNKTDFFREPQHFDFLTRAALPALDPDADRPPGERDPWTFRLWCCGCSTGEEPYTLAMVLAEYAATRPGFSFQILATDVSTRVLDHAARAIYEERRIDPVPAALRRKYLLRSRDPAKQVVRIAPELRRHVSFRHLNLMDAEYRVRERFDVVFFRNVMIYFDPDTQRTVIGKLCRQLVPGGFFFTGHSESINALQLPLIQVAAATHQMPR